MKRFVVAIAISFVVVLGCVEQSFEALNDLKNTSDALQDRVIQTYNLTNRQKDIISELQSLAIENV